MATIARTQVAPPREGTRENGPRTASAPAVWSLTQPEMRSWVDHQELPNHGNATADLL